jgi:uncharacterized protein YkwD
VDYALPRRVTHPTTLAGIVIALALLTAIPATQVRVGNQSPELLGGGCYKFSGADRQFAQVTNAARSSRNIGTMKLDPELSRVAKLHTKEMIKKNTLYHADAAALTRRVRNWSTLGENVGVGSTVSSLQDAFMNSTAHRDNILHKSFRYVGIGAITKDGRMWVTLNFEASANPGTSLSMPSC